MLFTALFSAIAHAQEPDLPVSVSLQDGNWVTVNTSSKEVATLCGTFDYWTWKGRYQTVTWTWHAKGPGRVKEGILPDGSYKKPLMFEAPEPQSIDSAGNPVGHPRDWPKVERERRDWKVTGVVFADWSHTGEHGRDPCFLDEWEAVRNSLNCLQEAQREHPGYTDEAKLAQAEYMQKGDSSCWRMGRWWMPIHKKAEEDLGRKAGG